MIGAHSAYPVVGHRRRLPMALLRRVFAAAYAAAPAAMEEHVAAADLDRTIVRLTPSPMLTPAAVASAHR